jgi:hypothetical protein
LILIDDTLSKTTLLLHDALPTFAILLQQHNSFIYGVDTWDLFEDIDIEDISTLIALGVVDEVRRSKAPRGST